MTGLTNNTLYDFQVQASNSYGTGSFSASVTGTLGAGRPRRQRQPLVCRLVLRPGLLLGPEQHRSARRRHHEQPARADPGRHEQRPDGHQCGLDLGGRPPHLRGDHRRPGLLLGRERERPAREQFDDARPDADAVTTGGGLTTTNVASIDTGYSHTCAVTTAHAVYCWGKNTNGQLGNNGTAQAKVPTAVTTGGGLTATNVARVSAG